jgi:prophage DNA circulation protein
MSWKDKLLDASFRGIPFQIDGIDETITRAVVVKEYPYRNGARTTDLGRTSRPITFSVVVYGDDYENDLVKLLDALDQPDPGELIHPIFGPMRAQFRSAHIVHEAGKVDYAHAQVEFVESGLDTPLFNRSLPSQKIAATNAAIDAALAPSEAQLDADIAVVTDASANFALALLADMLAAIDTLADLVATIDPASTWQASTDTTGTPGLTHPYLRDPGAFAADVASGYITALATIAATTASASTTSAALLATIWTAPQAALAQALLPPAPVAPLGPVSIPTDRTAQPGTQPFLLAHLAVQQTVAIASAAASLFGIEADAHAMTPPDISAVASSVRTRINDAIALVRATWPDPVHQRPMTEPLKALALHIADIAADLIRARPPLIERSITSTASLTLIAHFWYGDHRRADELRRLNPAVINPNFVTVGTVLRGYAQ